MANTHHSYHTKDVTCHPGQITLRIFHDCPVIVLIDLARTGIRSRIEARGEANRSVLSPGTTALHAKHREETNTQIMFHLKGKNMQPSIYFSAAIYPVLTTPVS
jgi:hypothetical protein